MLDVLLGLALVAVLAVMLSGTVGRQQKAAQRMADTREAVRLAEEVLAGLQFGTALPQAVRDRRAAVRVLDGAGPSATTRWAEVRATVNGRTAALAGPVPAASAAMIEGADAGEAGGAP